MIILNIVNTIWRSGDFPSYWRKAIINLITKSGKVGTNPANPGPITLISCISKTRNE